jgi:hypothetical protein
LIRGYAAFTSAVYFAALGLGRQKPEMFGSFQISQCPILPRKWATVASAKGANSAGSRGSHWKLSLQASDLAHRGAYASVPRTRSPRADAAPVSTS